MPSYDRLFIEHDNGLVLKLEPPKPVRQPRAGEMGWCPICKGGRQLWRITLRSFACSGCGSAANLVEVD